MSYHYGVDILPRREKRGEQSVFGTGIARRDLDKTRIVYLGERVQINRVPIPMEKIVERIAELREVADSIFDPKDVPNYPSFFEYMTVLAFDDGESVSEEEYFGDMLYYAIEGSCDIVLPNRRVALAAGEVLMVPAHVLHAVEGRSAFKLLQVCV